MNARRLTVITVLACVCACASSIHPLTPSLPVTPTAPSAPPVAVAPPAPDAVTGPPAPSAATGPANIAPPIPAATVAAPPNAPRVTVMQSGREQSDVAVRVALATGQQSVQLSASGGWSLYDRTGEHLLAQATAGDRWTVESCGGMLCAQSGAGRVPSIAGPLVMRPTDESSVLSYNGHRYRGELLVVNAGAGLMVVNRLSIESYLRGVVPLEIGTNRTMGEEAAVEAQAIAARSYVYKRLDDTRPYDVTATVMDQVYGGMDAEHPVSDSAVAQTQDMVLLYNGQVIEAPYHSTSGGVTAAASEVWNTQDEPYLVSVSDRIPGSDHYYDEQSPKFRWTRSYDESMLEAVLNKYLPKYAPVPGNDVGRVRDISETGRTPSGRVAGLTITTDRGSFQVRRNNVRFVLRTLGGDILPSTLFTIQTTAGPDGYLQQVTLQGTGNGHGVGMDQWGAIARARAGQDCLTILRTYYPGTTVGRII